MDTIFIREFRVEAQVGIYDWELVKSQVVEFDIDIGIPGPRAAESGDIADTVHYGIVVERITAELAAKRFGLLEELAEHVAGLITGEFKAPWVRIAVAKLGMMRGVKRVGVAIERGTR